MNELVIMQDHKAVTTSLKIAEVFGKEHKNVLRDIESYKKDVLNFEQMFDESETFDSYNRERKIYLLNRDGFTLLAMSFTGKKALEFKLKYIEAFNRMESNQIAIPTNPMEALKLMFDAQNETVENITAHDQRITELEENTNLSPSEYNTISHMISKRIYQIMDERRLKLSSKQKAELFKSLNGDIKKITKVRTRSNLRRQHFDTVYDFVLDWNPSKATLIIIQNMEE